LGPGRQLGPKNVKMVLIVAVLLVLAAVIALLSRCSAAVNSATFGAKQECFQRLGEIASRGRAISTAQ
jgi:hypothetical protein